MADCQPIDYRLRCHTKRTDLPADILRDIGEAYEEIGRLQKERNEARKDRAAYRIEIDRLIGQRDEARREVCGFHHLTGFLAGDYANSRGWDCFKDHPRGLGFPPSVNDFKIFLEGQDKIFLDKIDLLTAERDEAMILIETIAHDISMLSTRPAEIIKMNDLVYHINEWGDTARNILDKKDNSNV